MALCISNYIHMQTRFDLGCDICWGKIKQTQIEMSTVSHSLISGLIYKTSVNLQLYVK